MRITTNSAGLSGAKPTSMLTMPLLRSSCVVVSRVALDVERLVRRAALERALAEQAEHEGVEVEADLGPERLVVRLEHDPLGAAVQRLLEEQREPADRDVLPLRAEVVEAVHRARAPVDDARSGTCAEQLTACLLSTPFSASVRSTSRSTMPRMSASMPAGAFQTPRVASMRAISPAMRAGRTDDPPAGRRRCRRRAGRRRRCSASRPSSAASVMSVVLFTTSGRPFLTHAAGGIDQQERPALRGVDAGRAPERLLHRRLARRRRPG